MRNIKSDLHVLFYNTELVVVEEERMCVLKCRMCINVALCIPHPPPSRTCPLSCPNHCGCENGCHPKVLLEKVVVFPAAAAAALWSHLLHPPVMEIHRPIKVGPGHDGFLIQEDSFGRPLRGSSFGAHACVQCTTAPCSSEHLPLPSQHRPTSKRLCMYGLL